MKRRELKYNIDLLNNQVFQLLKNRDVEYFPDFLGKVFSEYKSALKEFTGTVSLEINKEEKRIKKLMELLKTSVDKYYEGFPRFAFNELDSAINLIKSELPVSPRSMTYMESQTNLYRIRVVEGIYSLDRKDVFHIPFEKRNLVHYANSKMDTMG